MSKNKKQSLQSAHQKPLLKRMWEHKVLYLMILPCLLFSQKMSNEKKN